MSLRDKTSANRDLIYSTKNIMIIVKHASLFLFCCFTHARDGVALFPCYKPLI